MLRLGLVPIVRPLFRGARMGLWEAGRDMLAALGPQMGFTLAAASPPVSEPDDARATAAAMSAAACDLIILQHVTFATGDLVAPFLGLSVPLAFWALPEATTRGPLPQNALCGLNLALSLPADRTVPATWLYGSASDQVFRSRLAVTVAALRAWKVLTHGRLLWVGGPAPGFDRFATPPDLPLAVDRLPLESFFDALAAVDEDRVSAQLETVEDETTIPSSELRTTLRIEAALERLAHGYDGVALRCWPEVPDRTGSMTCAAFARLADRGIVLGCEGDLGGVASMLAVAAATGQPAVLLDLTAVDDHGGQFWHCGNAPRVWAAGWNRLIPHFNRGLPAVRDMRLRPGPVSGLRLLEGHRAAVYGGTVAEREDRFDGVSGWIGDLRWGSAPVAPQEFLSCLLAARLPHHFAWGMGNAEEALLEACAWLGYSVLPPRPGTVVRWAE